VQLQQQLLDIENPTQRPSLHLITTLPSVASPSAAEIKASLPSVSLEHSIYRPVQDPASSYILRSAATGSRTIVNHQPLEEMTVEEFEHAVSAIAPVEESGRGWFFHFEGRIPQTTLQCMESLLRDYPEAQISLECEKPEREGMEALVDSYADVVFYSRSWALAKGYASAADCVKGQANATRPFVTSPNLRVVLVVDIGDRSISICTWGAGTPAMYDKSSQQLSQLDPTDLKPVTVVE
jgi:ketohexokinase